MSKSSFTDSIDANLKEGLKESVEFKKKSSISSNQGMVQRSQTSVSSTRNKSSSSSTDIVKTSMEKLKSSDKVVDRIKSDILDDVFGNEPSSCRVVKCIMSDVLDKVQEEETEKELIEKMPSLAVDKVRAMAFLKKSSPKDGISL